MSDKNVPQLQLKALKQLFTKVPGLTAQIKQLHSQKSTKISNVIPAARPYLATLLLEDWDAPLLWVTASSQRAEQLYQDLQPLLDENSQALIFPELEPDGDSSLNSPWRLQVLQTLCELSSGARQDLRQADPRSPHFQQNQKNNQSSAAPQRLLVIAPIPALFCPTLSSERMERAKLDVKVGDELDLSTLVELLVDIGYQRVSLVEKRGDIAVRGGIVDIYPLTSQPVRIEIFGDEVEAMRIFDETTQCSVGITDSVQLMPATELDGDPHNQAYFTDILYRKFPKTLVCLEDRELIMLNAKEFYQDWTTDNNECMERHVKSLLCRFKQADIYTGPLTPELCPARDYYNVPFKELPIFENYVQEMLETLPRWQKENARTIIISGQFARLNELFAENDISQVRRDDSSDLLRNPLGYGQIWLAAGYQSQGWELQLEDGQLRLLTDHELTGQRRKRFSLNKNARRRSELHLNDLHEGDLVVHLDYGIGRFVGIVNDTFQGVHRDMLRIQYADGSVSVAVERIDKLNRYHGLKDMAPPLSSLRGHKWTQAKAKTIENVQQVAEELVKIYAMREHAHGHSYPADTAWQRDFAQAFPYKETPDQLKAIRDVDKDLAMPRPMDRLICGDVGYGKTEIALRAAFKVATEGRQVAVLVPTTILAQQHYQTFRERMASFPVRLALLSRVKSAKEQKQIIADLGAGQIDIVIGTHRLLSKDVAFKQLGLIIIDEEHRFGVMHKERLKEMRSSVDVLTMSATPIPRTLQMAMYGIRELSLIETPPKDRLPIKTYLQEHRLEIIRSSILRELSREGQVFYLHNRVQNIASVQADVQRMVPQARIMVAHGQMSPTQLEKIMSDFYDGLFDVLISTTIIENGLDIPNVNTIIIDNAQNFGLAQLYQLRGRVGRSTKQGYCYLLVPPNRELNEEAQKRLETLRDFTNLGAGYQIARRDMELRGAGNMLGAKQSGHVQAVGFQLYCQMLQEAVAKIAYEAKLPGAEQIASQPKIPDFTLIELPITTGLPKTYIDNTQQQIGFYRRIATATAEEQLEALAQELVDRYGPLPEESRDLLQLMKLRLKASQLLLPHIRVVENNLYIPAPLLKCLNGQKALTPIQKKQLYKASGWSATWYPGQYSLALNGVYQNALKGIYPSAPELLSRITKAVEVLGEWEMAAEGKG